MGLFSKKPNIESMIKDKDIEGLILALEHKNHNVRKSAVNGLGKLGDSKAIDPLIKVLNKEENKYVIQQVGYALELIGDPKAVEGLILALDHKNGTVRFYAGQCLGHLGDSKAVEPLINALSDKDLGVRSGAVTALRNIKDPRAIKPLQQILDEEIEDSLKFSIRESLAYIEGKPFYITFSNKNPDS